MMDYGQEIGQHEEERDQLIDHFQNMDMNAVGNLDAMAFEKPHGGEFQA